VSCRGKVQLSRKRSCSLFFRETVQLSRQKSDSVISEMQFSRFTVNLTSSDIKAEDYLITRAEE
jgi:hypothetical protein